MSEEPTRQVEGQADSRTDAIDQIRHFNRHYVPAMHLLDQRYQHTDYTTMEADVLIELSEQPGRSARELIQLFGIDKGYLSRMLGRFEGEGLLERTASPDDGRVKLLSLTDAGEALAAELAEAGRRIVGEAVGEATDEEYEEIAACMRRILRIMGRA